MANTVLFFIFQTILYVYIGAMLIGVCYGIYELQKWLRYKKKIKHALTNIGVNQSIDTLMKEYHSYISDSCDKNVDVNEVADNIKKWNMLTKLQKVILLKNYYGGEKL